MKKGTITIGVVVIGLLAIIGWRWMQKDSTSAKMANAQKARALAPANVVIATAEPRIIHDRINVVGTVQSPYDVKISPKVTGVLDTVNVREGDHVSVGQVLASLDPSSLTGGVLAAKANLAQAKSKLAEAQITFDPSRVGVSATIDQQYAALESAQADDVQTLQTYRAQLAAAEAQVADSQSKVSSANAALVSSQAQLQSAEATYANAETVLARTTNLYKQAFVAAQDVDNAKTAALQAKSQVGVAKSQVAAAKAGVVSAKALLNVAQRQVTVTEATGKSNIAASHAKLTQAKAAYKVAVANKAQNPAYLQNVQALQAAVNAAQAQVNQAQALLGETQLVSPIQGTITERDLDPGAVAQPGTTVVAVQYLKWVYVTAYVPIEQSGDVYQGQVAEITIDGMPGKVFHGTLVHISPAADPTSRQFLVQVKLDNPGELLRPGMFGHVIIVAKQVNAAVAIPREALNVSADGTTETVTVVDSQNVAHVVKVSTGAQDAYGYQILSGLEPGDKVVTITYSPLKDGQKVNPSTSDQGNANSNSAKASQNPSPPQSAPPGGSQPVQTAASGKAKP